MPVFVVHFSNVCLVLANPFGVAVLNDTSITQKEKQRFIDIATKRIKNTGKNKEYNSVIITEDIVYVIFQQPPWKDPDNSPGPGSDRCSIIEIDRKTGKIISVLGSA